MSVDRGVAAHYGVSYIGRMGAQLGLFGHEAPRFDAGFHALKRTALENGAWVEYAPGWLFVMGGSCQRTWQHAIPKVARAAPRIAIMFRPTWEPDPDD